MSAVVYHQSRQPLGAGWVTLVYTIEPGQENDHGRVGDPIAIPVDMLVNGQRIGEDAFFEAFRDTQVERWGKAIEADLKGQARDDRDAARIQARIDREAALA